MRSCREIHVSTVHNEQSSKVMVFEAWYSRSLLAALSSLRFLLHPLHVITYCKADCKPAMGYLSEQGMQPILSVLS